jgi:peptidoglycan/LPS O-acetylase OafA/YrhL
MNLGKLNLVLLLGLVGLAGYLFSTISVATSLGIGLVAPVLVLVFVVLANRNIQKDEKLVRSADRLR